MDLRISKAYVNTPFNNAVPQYMRRPKQPIFTYQNKQIPPQNIYYQKNPYLLRLSPSQPRMRPIANPKIRNQNHSRQSSDHSSHRSLRVVRVNGLKQVEKPKIVRVQDQHSLHSSRANELNRRYIEREIQLEAENRALRQENEGLKQRLRKFQDSKQREIGLLDQKIIQLVRITHQLQAKMQKTQNQWRIQVKKLQEYNSAETS